jgi:ribonuclease-3
MAAQALSCCEALIGHIFTDKLLLLQALNAGGLPIYYANEYHTVQKNDALAILGDKYMDAVLCRWWWGKSAHRIKGHWNELRQEKCGNGPLASLGKGIGIDRCVIKDPGTTMVSDKMVATVVEAVMGAVYLDAGEEVLEKVMKGLGFDEHAYL